MTWTTSWTTCTHRPVKCIGTAGARNGLYKLKLELADANKVLMTEQTSEVSIMLDNKVP